MYRMRGHPSAPSPDLTFSQVAGVFDNLSLEYGAGIVTSALQRQHNDPKHMPRVVLFTMHVTIAFSILLNPPFYLAECVLLGMHKKSEGDIENAISYADASTLAKLSVVMESFNPSERRSKMSCMSIDDAENPYYGDEDAEVAEYRGPNTIKYVLLRMAIIVVLVILPIVLKNHFSGLLDFVGSSCTSLNSIILPIAFLLKKFWN
ncbi:hypothetical protein BBJ29_009960 [Phytophthora kernoviae]|uniref:Amino acid transporter transmembrane domain-containing protein n=1 Tax=Phytophthora kernoviae TaxID=325452 RepID=A0A421G708_9STRA|nr:hypothetical protein BBJ29_009960 [Phytophthora kernoviae]